MPLSVLSILLVCICVVLASATLSESNKYLDAVPVYLGSALPNHPVTFSAKCFQVSTVSLTLDSHHAEIDIMSKDPKSHTCIDWFLITNGVSFKLKSAIRHGHHRISMKLTPEEFAITQTSGVHVFQISLNIINYVRDAFELYNIVKRKDPKATMKLVEDQQGFRYQRRHVPFVDYEKLEPYIKSGDLISMTNFNDIEALIMVGSNSRSGHAAMFLRDPDTHELFVAEAQPPEEGGFGENIFRTPFKQWMKSAINGSYFDCTPETCHAVWLPLSDEARSYYNERKA
ncbi:hypothetical protein P9112_001273 [Eukaryota sp. TZLM1-RC]